MLKRASEVAREVILSDPNYAEATLLIEADRIAVTALYREAMRRFLKGTPSSLLDAPCMWCGYNSQGYWQKVTHGTECPWHDVGSFDERAGKLEAVLGL